MPCIVHHIVTMPFNPSKYSDEVQKVSKDTLWRKSSIYLNEMGAYS